MAPEGGSQYCLCVNFLQDVFVVAVGSRGINVVVGGHR